MEINYKIIRSRRRTVGFEISREGSLTVRAPYSANDGYIKKLLQEKISWINKNINLALERRNAFRRKEFVDGEKFLYMGEEYRLRIVGGRSIAIVGEEILLPVKIVPLAKIFLIRWYKRSARKIIADRVYSYSQKMNLKYEKIKISNAGTRWGSCSVKNNLNFSWRLIMAPVEVIDYVIVHEIAHIIEKNHSKDFWNIVGDIVPDFKEKRLWLRNNGHLLDI